MNQFWTQQILNHLSLPDETIPGQTLIEIYGNQRVLIEQHKGVVQYSTEQILVRMKQGMLGIYGSDLHLCRMIPSQLIICGQVHCVKFEEADSL